MKIRNGLQGSTAWQQRRRILSSSVLLGADVSLLAFAAENGKNQVDRLFCDSLGEDRPDIGQGVHGLGEGDDGIIVAQT